jgi:hypothetical protein
MIQLVALLVCLSGFDTRVIPAPTRNRTMRSSLQLLSRVLPLANQRTTPKPTPVVAAESIHENVNTTVTPKTARHTYAYYIQVYKTPAAVKALLEQVVKADPGAPVFLLSDAGPYPPTHLSPCFKTIYIFIYLIC